MKIIMKNRYKLVICCLSMAIMLSGCVDEPFTYTPDTTFNKWLEGNWITLGEDGIDPPINIEINIIQNSYIRINVRSPGQEEQVIYDANGFITDIDSNPVMVLQIKNHYSTKDYKNSDWVSK